MWRKLRLLEEVDVVSFLEELGIQNIREKGQEVFYSCPFHDDNEPSASMQEGSTLAHCFGCGWSGNAITFLADLEGVMPLKATQWIRERFGKGFREPNETGLLGEVESILNPLITSPKSDFKIISEKEADKRRVQWSALTGKGDPRLEYLLSREIHVATLEAFDVGWDEISQRISIPVRDGAGNLIGFKGRAIPPQTPRYLILGGPEYGFDTYEAAKVVFALDRAEGRELILCEGELNAVAMHQKGYKNAVGISGKVLSEEQAMILRSSCDKITLIFDEEEDALKASEKLDQYMPVSIVPAHDRDPAEMRSSEISELLRNSTLSLLV